MTTQPPDQPPDQDREDGFMHRINRALRRYLPGTEKDWPAGTPHVHRDFVADAFAAGMRAAVTVTVPDDELATEFEVYCEEAFTE